MGNSFLQKFVLMVIAGLAAACLIYLFRHIVEQAYYETGPGWRESMKPKQQRH